MDLYYRSTRSDDVRVTASQAILKGLADDGGLYVPESIPALDASFEELSGMDYRQVAYEVMKLFLTDFTEEELKACINKAYDSKFDTDEIAPLVKADGAYFLELFHGSTIAFKDMALSILPHLMITSARKNNIKNDIVILTATSGDTGKAALAGFADVEGTKIIVFYPKNGVSPIQEKQMVTQKGKNTYVVGIHGNFDDAQTGVKKVFADADVAAELEKRGIRLSSANSINWGRLVPQIVYYFYAYFRLAEQGAVEWGKPVDFCVPTGNFGDILAGYYAKQMGLPVGRLVCASNKNNVLTDFLRTGTYDARRTFYKTTSPSMDILISSNLERLLYHVSGSSEKVAGWMQELSATGKYTVDAETLAKIQQSFAAGYADDADGAAEIKARFDGDHYLCDTHTAVAFRVAETRRTDAPMVVLSTASPFKFPRDVLTALGGEAPASDFAAMAALTAKTGAAAPASLRELDKLPVRFNTVIEPADIRAAALR